MRGVVRTVAVALVLFPLGVVPALGAVGSRTLASGLSPFGTGPCNTQPQSGALYPHTEVEPWLDVDPTSAGDADGADLIGAYQQDRYSTGGARGLGMSVSTDGGASFSVVPANQLPRFTECTGNRLYERASDPWVSIGPTGDAHQISLSFNDTRNLDNAVLVSKSSAASGGLQWSPPITLIRDTNPAVFNDKESITADQNDANYVYAVWDRLVFPNERTRGHSPENTAAFRAPTYFSRTTNGGTSWEPARAIFDPGQNDQTIGNQIVALGDGDLVNVMTVFRNDNSKKSRARRWLCFGRRTRVAAPAGAARSTSPSWAPSGWWILRPAIRSEPGTSFPRSPLTNAAATGRSMSCGRMPGSTASNATRSPSPARLTVG